MPATTSTSALTRIVLAQPHKPGQVHWRELARAATAHKAVSTDPAEKNRLWFLHNFAGATLAYLDAYRQLGRGEHLDAWCTLENAEIGFAHLARNAFIPTLGPFVEERAALIDKWQDLFPYKYFISPAMRYKRWACSICGKQSSPVEPCGHRQGQVYDGELCLRIIHEAEPLHVAFVTDPVQKYSVIQQDYDYHVVDFVLGHLSGPFHPWTGYWTHKRIGHDYFADRPLEGPCPCISGLRYAECCRPSGGVNLPRYEMAATGGPRKGAVSDALHLHSGKPKPEPLRDGPREYQVRLLKT